MARKILTQEQAELQGIHADLGLAALQAALAHFKLSDNKKTAERVRAAISSAKGSVRICGYRITRAGRH